MNTEKGLISIILPTNHLDLDLDKIATWAMDLDAMEWEIILVVDEGKQDFSPELARLSRIERTIELDIVRGSFGNPGGARNAGITRAKGNWVVFWDSDDLPNPQATRRMVDRAEHMEADIAIGSFLVNSKLHLTPKRKLNKTTNLKLIKHLTSNPGLWRFCIKAELIREVQFPELRMGEDQVFISLIDFSSRKILLSDEVVYNYNSLNPNSLTNTFEAVAALDMTIDELANRILSGKTNKLGRYFLLRMYATWAIKIIFRLDIREMMRQEILTIKVLRSLVHCQNLSTSRKLKVIS